MEALAAKAQTFLPAAYTFLHYLCTNVWNQNPKN